MIIKQKDAWKLGLAARVLDGLNVLNTLSKHKNIDENKIGITGYSYGGMVAFYTAYPKLLDLVSNGKQFAACLLYTSPSPRDRQKSRMPSSA